MDAIINLFHQGTSVIVPFIILLGVLIFVHELGHFSVAKFFGIRVEVFSLGFGRKIFKKKWGDTTYCLSIIPFGGYVKMYGDDLSADVPPDQRRYSFSHQPVLPRIAVVLAGPLMNAFFATFLFMVISAVGEEVIRPKVGDIYEGTQAYAMGFRTDDVVKDINGTAVSKWEDIKKIVEESAAKNLSFTVMRGGQEVKIQGSPVSIVNKNILSSQSQVGDIDGFSYSTRASAIGISDPTSPAAQSGLKTGDIVRNVNGREILKWDELSAALNQAVGENKRTLEIGVERGPDSKVMKISLSLDPKYPLAGLDPSDLYLSNVMPKSAAADAGIQIGDKLLSIKGKKLNRWEDVVKTVQSYKESDGPLKVEYIRSGRTFSAEITPRLLKQTDNAGLEQQNYALGIVTGLVYAVPETFVAKETNPGVMISKGIEEMVHWTSLTAISFVKLAQGKVSSKSIGGPLMIGKLASDTWRIGISPFLKIMAIISINLFLLNMMPIPVLDGGHLLFFSIEFVKGSPLSFRKIEVLQQVGMFLLLALMVFSMFNDIVRFFTS